MILAIDPANVQSAYCVIDIDTYKPIEFDKIDNNLLLNKIDELLLVYDIQALAIEMVACYGMAVGETVFETCVWVGRFHQKCLDKVLDIEYVYRKDVKINVCNSMKAKDSNIRQALIDRFGYVGTKNSQGWFYGFRADIWSAYGVGATYLDKLRGDA